jgi:hypothetical protein
MFKKIKVKPVDISYSERTGGTYGYCVNSSAGKEASKGKGWWGGGGQVSNVEIDAIYDTETSEIFIQPQNAKTILLDDYINLKQVKESRIAEVKEKINKEDLKFILNNINEFKDE